MNKKFTFKLIDKATDEMLYYINIYGDRIQQAKETARTLVGELEVPQQYYDSVGFDKKYDLVLWQVTKIEIDTVYDYSNNGPVGGSKMIGKNYLT